MSKSAKPHGHTSKPVDHIAAKLMHSPKPEVRQVAAAALSDTRTSPRAQADRAHEHRCRIGRRVVDAHRQQTRTHRRRFRSGRP